MGLPKAGARIIFTWISYIFYLKSAHGGKSANKVGIAGIATMTGGSSGGYVVNDQNSKSNGFTQEEQGLSFKNEADRLKHELLVVRDYDRSLRPVKDQKKITSVLLDFTFRQILDLDEKNQVLKTYLWMKYIWTDEFLAWNETEFEGIDKIWLPAASLWKPDIVVYEETGQRDYSPRLPYYKITSKGRVTASEPLVIETTCSVDILFFPFDHQRCSFTFTSWTFPSSKIDVLSARDTGSMMESIETYFLKTGEWNVYDVHIVKTSENFAMLQEESDGFPSGGIDYNNESLPFSDDLHGEVGADYSGGGPSIDTSHIRKMTLDITKKVEDSYPDRITAFHWADIKYTFILRRNSSLYMQSMLFPAILLTTVAVLGFYLPPDSGERIGLQITILLTFMVFLLTVGEMFPASTGPFLGVYYVLCMGLLGINLFMTVLVLHLHYMPSAAVVGTKEDGKRFVKPVPKWVRMLLRIAKFRIPFKKNDDGRGSPTTEIVRGILKTGRLSIKIPKASAPNTPLNKKNGVLNKSFKNTDEKKASADERTFEPVVICTKVSTSYPGKMNKIRVSPVPMEKMADGTTPPRTEEHSGNETATSEDWSYVHHNASAPSSSISNSSFSKKSRRKHRRSNSEYIDLHNRLAQSMDKVKSYLQAQTDHLRENDISDDIENEWKAMSRVIDRLCMQTYIGLLILSHIIIITIALAQSFSYDDDGQNH